MNITHFFKSFLTICLLFGSLVYAQTHRFIYEYHYKMDSTATDFMKRNMVLDINPNDVKFYDYELVKVDSTNLTRGENSTLWEGMPTVTRKKNSFENTNYEVINLTDMYAYPTKDEMKWQLSQDTKKVGEYTLQKATTHFGGRKWVAWFERDMPFVEGPYKFRGLPGLIFEISDTQDNFKFTLVKSYKLPKTYNTTRFLEKYNGQKAFAVKEDFIVKKKLEEYNDPLRELREEFKRNPPSGDNEIRVFETKITSLDQFKELTEQVQSFIRKNYNPIERNKAIQYK